MGETIVDSEGNRDRFECFGLAKDHLVGISKHSVPTIVNENLPLLRSYTDSLHFVMTVVLDKLSVSLGLPGDTLSSLHRILQPSQTGLRFLKCPVQPLDDRGTSIIPHTDMGSITILFNRLGGLQVLPPGDNAAWGWVRPIHGHAIINLGDAMAKLTRGVFRSSIHRVTYPPGAQANLTRYSVAYLARPEDTTVMKGLDTSNIIPKLAHGEKEDNITMVEWTIQRCRALKRENYKREAWAQASGLRDKEDRLSTGASDKVVPRTAMSV